MPRRKRSHFISVSNSSPTLEGRLANVKFCVAVDKVKEAGAQQGGPGLNH